MYTDPSGRILPHTVIVVLLVIFCILATNPAPNDTNVSGNDNLPPGYIAFYMYDSSYFEIVLQTSMFDYWLYSWSQLFFGLAERVDKGSSSVLNGFGHLISVVSLIPFFVTSFDHYGNIGLSAEEMQRAKWLETGNIATTYAGATIGGSLGSAFGPFGGAFGAYVGASIANEVYDWTIYQFYRMRYNP